MIKLATIRVNKTWLIGRKEVDWLLEIWRSGIVKSIRREETRAITPPNLLGMDRKIA